VGLTFRGCVSDHGGALLIKVLYIVRTLQALYIVTLHSIILGHWLCFFALLIKAPVHVKDCIFENNTARMSGGAVSIQHRRTGGGGGGRSLGAEKGSSKGGEREEEEEREEVEEVRFEGCRFVNNSAANGGGVANNGGRVILDRCCWHNNTAINGGAIFVARGHVQMLASECRSNAARRVGGAGFVSSGRLSISRSLIQGNKAETYDGGIHVDSALGTLDMAATVLQDNASPPHPIIARQLTEHLLGPFQAVYWVQSRVWVQQFSSLHATIKPHLPPVPSLPSTIDHVWSISDPQSQLVMPRGGKAPPPPLPPYQPAFNPCWVAIKNRNNGEPYTTVVHLGGCQLCEEKSKLN
jgi:hypothetical protein